MHTCLAFIIFIFIFLNESLDDSRETRAAGPVSVRVYFELPLVEPNYHWRNQTASGGVRLALTSSSGFQAQSSSWAQREVLEFRWSFIFYVHVKLESSPIRGTV
jgi:hypothetical protein